jgi:hypothetical protein
MKTSDTATTTWYASSVNKPDVRPASATMNENSPICAWLAPTTRRTDAGRGRTRTWRMATTDFPTFTIAATARIWIGWCTKMPGSSGIPTDTNNWTVKTSVSADLGELERETRIRDESRREQHHRDAGH